MPAFVEYKQKLNIVINEIEKIKDASQLKEKYEIIRNQAIVLIVENFESFMNDCVKVLINSYPGTIEWPDKRKTLPVDINILRYSSPTIGDLVVSSIKGEVNFQDLQSTLRFFKEYLDVDINLTSEDNIIFAQALRNIVVHNSSIIDHNFLSQVRNTKYKEKFEDQKKIMLSEAKYDELIKDFSEFSEIIINKLKNKAGEK